MRTAFLTASLLAAAAPPVTAAGVEYVRDIKPILQAKCVSCHGAVRQKAGLRLDAGPLVLKGGKNGPVVVPGKPGESVILDAVTGNERDRMPPEGEAEPLDTKQLALLRDWISQGAKVPDEPTPPDPRTHWAYRAPVRPPIPAIANLKSPSSNPVDAFLAAERARHNLAANPPADKATLLRRVYLDLVGIPPTPDEWRTFLADNSPDAYEKVVDKLLASPMYGERWGRHWMDVWRYSDPFGYGEEYRYSQRHIWRWRDWIIESLNADKGYDRMVVEMLAGDEVAPTDPDTLRATGYIARNWYKFNRNIWVQDAVEYTAAGFLGVTLRCARCHDHKYDPISQADYYRFRAFFEPHDVRIDAMPGQPDTKKDGLARAFDANPEALTYLFRRGDERNPDKSRVMTPAAPAVFGTDLVIRPVRVGPPSPAVAAVASGAVLRSPRPEFSTGRRLALARWIADRQNPLTARVAVNHVWMRHFGAPLVGTVANFGLNGQKPTHPELLDWLAVEFMEPTWANPERQRGGNVNPVADAPGSPRPWSMKHLHRLIVTSAAYRMSSSDAVPASKATDPENRWYWRANPRRMEAEAVRDSLLAVAGQLDTTKGGAILDEKLGMTSRRRSVYFRFNAEYRMLFLDQFDPASPTECYERRESVIPQQSLALMNSSLALNLSRSLAKQLSEKDADPTGFVAAAFERVLCRPPTKAEAGRCEQFLREQAELYKEPGKLTPFPPGPDAVTAPSADPAQRAREDLVLVLFNHNDFVTIR